jgi:hypothetical protein
LYWAHGSHAEAPKEVTPAAKARAAKIANLITEPFVVYPPCGDIGPHALIKHENGGGLAKIINPSFRLI